MRRIHLFELEDQPWLPAWLRDAVTDHLSRYFSSRDLEPLHIAMAQQLVGALRSSGSSSILDLCSGAGGPVRAVLPIVREELGRDVTVTLTDLYPNRDAVGSADDALAGLTVLREPLDACSVPAEIAGVRCMFNAIHHFRPEQVASVLRSATDGSHAVLVFEPFERSMSLAARIALGGLLGGWRDARRFRGSTVRRFALHVLLPLALSWDGAVSALRAYDVDELLAIAESSGSADQLDWTAQRLSMPWGGLTLLAGVPACHPSSVRKPS